MLNRRLPVKRAYIFPRPIALCTGPIKEKKKTLNEKRKKKGRRKQNNPDIKNKFGMRARSRHFHPTFWCLDPFVPPFFFPILFTKNYTTLIAFVCYFNMDFWNGFEWRTIKVDMIASSGSSWKCSIEMFDFTQRNGFFSKIERTNNSSWQQGFQTSHIFTSRRLFSFFFRGKGEKNVEEQHTKRLLEKRKKKKEMFARNS